MKVLLPGLLLCSLLLGSSFVELADAGTPDQLSHPDQISPFCDGKCKERCKKAGVLDRCLRYCGICCKECKCVPSGTYGNKHECPCYRDKRNDKGSPKCP